ncbi:transcriptional regulator with XRE-family HTH domain [Anaeroplasma bactoclasticum]|jgi:transcriptional regulator with XRE-family HTH domain|uniref:Transcriptional regulator with XRE-family HTH domain n=1 Tax=Anaeroplasma bactoclasticum TaxID=2088 RepID=A0A397RZI7_9MOLU|nr:helix-turn-helix transcriptional regulator [Anaeroplasma bactoclasticum]RIA77976.1 transcriptional regulator with XRE-family HTH domain [Anaeroplasma bactoclasticum]
MSDLKKLIAQNLVELRKSRKYTQQDIANMVQYSDKAVSKWEKGESLPDIEVLYQICNIYGVTLDYLTHDGAYDEKKEYVIPQSEFRNRIIITALFSSIIWMGVIIVYVYQNLYQEFNNWPIFIWAVPANCVLLWFFNMKWGRRKWFIVIGSIFVWTLIAGLYLQILYTSHFEYNYWMLFLIGIPIQVALGLLTQLRHY